MNLLWLSNEILRSMLNLCNQSSLSTSWEVQYTKRCNRTQKFAVLKIQILHNFWVVEMAEFVRFAKYKETKFQIINCAYFRYPADEQKLFCYLFSQTQYVYICLSTISRKLPFLNLK